MIKAAGNPMFDARIRTRLVQMADTLDAEEIALRTGYDEEDVQYVLDHAGVRLKSQWWVRCNRTGRSFVARSKRGAYRLVCLKGLVDWDWGRGDGGALLLPPPSDAPQIPQFQGGGA
jgi:hypothetical protein